MALTSTLYDFDVALNHVDRNLHLGLAVRTARHPSETLDRVWLRVLAYLWLYEERLAFGPGLSDPDEPDLRADDLTGTTTMWVRVGRPDPVKLQREADRAGRARVVAFFESADRLEAFREAARVAALPRLGRVELVAVDGTLLAALAAREERRAKLVVTVSDDHLYVERGGEALDGPLLVRRPA
ncbi:MAG TPA: YaeQ family protein [Anaeromyxobacteraceae bacterium]|nr:YaeQ family protein [Anaeromyxobacteraceae bacterium]